MAEPRLIAQIYNPVIAKQYGGDPTTTGGSALATLVANLFRVAIVVGGIALLLMLVIGGLQWILAGGDKGKVEEARNRITNAILGIVVLISAVAIISFIGQFFELDLLNPTLPQPK